MKKQTPLWFLIIVICLIIYGSISLILLNKNELNLNILVSKINIFVTLFWIFFNIVMLYIFVNKNYEKEAIIFSIYYIAINLFNTFNIYFGWITLYETMRNLSITTKIIEVGVVTYLLVKRYMKK